MGGFMCKLQPVIPKIPELTENESYVPDVASGLGQIDNEFQIALIIMLM